MILDIGKCLNADVERLTDFELTIISMYLECKYNSVEISSTVNSTTYRVNLVIKKFIREDVIKNIWNIRNDAIVHFYIKEGLTYVEIGNIFNCSYATIYSILKKLLSKEERVAVRKNRRVIRDYNNGDSWNCKRGFYFSKKNDRYTFLRSKLERLAMERFDDDDCVIGYTYEPIHIDLPNGKIYIPDFEVEYSDGRVEIIEVKYKYAVKTQGNLMKFKCAEEYCKLKGYNFLILTNELLK